MWALDLVVRESQMSSPWIVSREVKVELSEESTHKNIVFINPSLEGSDKYRQFSL
jgi:hypothetical protein